MKWEQIEFPFEWPFPEVLEHAARRCRKSQFCLFSFNSSSSEPVWRTAEECHPSCSNHLLQVTA